MGLRVPKNKIKEGLYTSGNEFVEKDSYKPYKGYYYSMGGAFFSGKVFNIRAIEVIKNSSETVKVKSFDLNTLKYFYNKKNKNKNNNNSNNATLVTTTTTGCCSYERMINNPANHGDLRLALRNDLKVSSSAKLHNEFSIYASQADCCSVTRVEKSIDRKYSRNIVRSTDTKVTREVKMLDSLDRQSRVLLLSLDDVSNCQIRNTHMRKIRPLVTALYRYGSLLSLHNVNVLQTDNNISVKASCQMAADQNRDIIRPVTNNNNINNFKCGKINKNKNKKNKNKNKNKQYYNNNYIYYNIKTRMEMGGKNRTNHILILKIMIIKLKRSSNNKKINNKKNKNKNDNNSNNATLTDCNNINNATLVTASTPVCYYSINYGDLWLVKKIKINCITILKSKSFKVVCKIVIDLGKI